MRNIIYEIALINPKYVGYVEEFCGRKPWSHEPRLKQALSLLWNSERTLSKAYLI